MNQLPSDQQMPPNYQVLLSYPGESTRMAVPLRAFFVFNHDMNVAMTELVDRWKDFGGANRGVMRMSQPDE